LLLGGVSEVAEALGISRQRVAILRKRPEFPGPVAELSSGPVWDMAQVARWMQSNIRPVGRPPRSDRRRIIGERFAIEDKPIGSGGFADVYRATDLIAEARGDDDDIVIAVKVLRAVEEDEARRRFARELRMMERIDHENVIPIIASGDDADGRPWYAMPLAVGNLAEVMSEFVGEDVKIVDTMRQIAAGLTHLHAEGVYHRDLTPMNVLLTPTGSWAISDFGLAREAERRTATLTSTHANLGTFLYQAPETMTAAKFAAEPADIYSLGKILEALVAGNHPLPGGMPPNGAFNPIIKKATAFDPMNRYETVADLLGDVERAVAAPKGRWETTDEAITRLEARLGADKITEATLDEALEVALETDIYDMAAVCRVCLMFPKIPRAGIANLWERRPDDLRTALGVYNAGLMQLGFDFGYCDVLANFSETVVRVTGDNDILRDAIQALCALGTSHNRFHVRSTVWRLLQEARTADVALSALEGIRRADTDHVEWTLENRFAIRSLHPALRDGIEQMLGEEQQ
jgi:hypothetical protein